MDGVIVFGLLFVLLILGVPIAVSLGMAGVISLLIAGDTSFMAAMPQRLFSGVDSFPLMAIIFFMMAGELMVQGGISSRLVALAKCFLYRLKGSLAIITMVACGFFGALSGSAMATTAAIGNIMYPEMVKDGSYPKDWALVVPAVGGILGPMIPPSVSLVVFGTLSNTSVGDLFTATIIPGILICLILCVTAYFIAKKKGYGTNVVEREDSTFQTFKDGIWALFTPLIILGGIYSGIFSATESAAIACLYAIIIGKFVYKELTWKSFYKAIHGALVSSAGVMFLIACATLFGWILTIQNIPQAITMVLLEKLNSPIVFLLVVNLLYLVAGMFMEAISIMLICVPLLAPVATALGINMVHFGVISAINLATGAITPPFGGCLFVANGIDRSIKLESLFKAVIPFVITTFIGILLISYVPGLSLWLIS